MTSPQMPFIPENAPFSPEQRTWLNGLLAGLFVGPNSVAENETSLEIGVCYASQSGVAERLAKKMAKLLKAQGHTANVISAEKWSAAELALQKHVLFFASTYGEGDPPDSAKALRDEIFAEDAPRLHGLRYSVLCLGDRNYEYFCKFGIDLDERLQQLGATRISPRVESDVDVDAPFESWRDQVLSGLNSTDSGQTSNVIEMKPTAGPEALPTLHTRERPYHADLLEQRLLTHESSTKRTVHVGLNLGQGELHYEAGDACGVLAENDPLLVGDVLAALRFSGAEIVSLDRVGEVTIREALLRYLQFTCLTRKMLQNYAGKAGSRALNDMLLPEHKAELDAYLYGRGLIDLLHQFPGVIAQAGDLVDLLPRLAPRLYSISSSPAAHGRELHCTISVVRYRAHERERGGVASTMLGERCGPGDRVPIYIQPNKRFRLPKDSASPIIMIGPGTGIAPFRSFLHERKALGQKGKNWLFFGERSASSDFLYRSELEEFCSSGHLTRLDTAFSRDQSHKVYVQDRMLAAGAEFWRWLQEGAQVYVCGDASRMAKDVEAALHRVIETHGAMSAEAAQEYVSELQESHRYHKDVY